MVPSWPLGGGPSFALSFTRLAEDEVAEFMFRVGVSIPSPLYEIRRSLGIPSQAFGDDDLKGPRRPMPQGARPTEAHDAAVR
jgi:hypothetical protein